MDTKVNFDVMGQNIVYVKPVLAADLPDDMQEQVEFGGCLKCDCAVSHIAWAVFAIR